MKAFIQKVKDYGTGFLICLGVLVSGVSFNVNAQCTSAPYGLYGSITPACTGNFETITTCGYRGEYSNVSVIAGYQYEFQSSVSTDYVTIATTDNIPLVWGTQSVVWTATFTGTVRFFNHVNFSCGTSTSCMTRSVKCSGLIEVPVILGLSTVCPGTKVTLTASVSSLGIDENIFWYSEPEGNGTLLGVGTTITITATGSQTIYARVEGGAGISADASFSLIVDTLISLGLDGDSRTCVVNQDGFVHFSKDGRLIASVNSYGQNLGSVTSVSYVHGNPIDVPACQNPLSPQFNTMVLGRSWLISPDFQPASDVTVRLYLDIDEYNELESQANINLSQQDDVLSIADLQLSKYHNEAVPALENNSPLDNCTSGQTTAHAQLAWDQANNYFIGFDANGYYVEYDIPSFSEFWLHGNSTLSPLPVSLTYFDVDCSSGEAEILWQTVSENNSDYFSVLRSNDGIEWRELDRIDAAGTSKEELNYRTTDFATMEGIVYYKLIQVDLDGEATEYGPVSADCKVVNNDMSISLYPNPANENTLIKIENPIQGEGRISLVDISGRAVMNWEVQFDQTVYVKSVSCEDFASGAYRVWVVFPDGSAESVIMIKN